LLQAKVQAREVLQAALLRHRLQLVRPDRMCVLGLLGFGLLGLSLLGPGDLLCSAAVVLHRFGLLRRSRRDVLLGFFSFVLQRSGILLLFRSGSDLLHSGGHLLRSGPDLLHRPGELLCRSLGLN
jgi:hypothetical protein